MSANRIAGIRAAVYYGGPMEIIHLSREHNNANILCLPADLVGNALLQRIIEVWLKTPFEGGRHQTRVEKIGDIEKAQCELPKQ